MEIGSCLGPYDGDQVLLRPMHGWDFSGYRQIAGFRFL